MSFFTHAFEAEIVRHPIGNGARIVHYTVVYLPPAMVSQLPFDAHPRLRVTGEIADVPVEGAWQPAGDGRRYLMVPKVVFEDAGVAVGDRVEVRFKVGDQDAVDVPDALGRLLEGDEELAAKWVALTPGARRAFAHRVRSAKTEPTIVKRVGEVAHMVREGLRYGKGGSVRKRNPERST